MSSNSENAQMQAKIVSILVRVFDLPSEAVTESTRLADFFSCNHEGLRSFVVKLEETLKVPVGEKAVECCSTVGELAAYCAKCKSSVPSGRQYVVVCRMPGGKICERHYYAKRHEAAAQLAVDDGAEEVLSVEREDREGGSSRKQAGVWSVLVLPLMLGLLLAVAGVVFFWYIRGCPKLW